MRLQPYLKRIIEGHETLSRADSAQLLQTILRGEATELELAALLVSLAARAPAPTEIAGFVDTMRFAATPIPLSDAERTTLTDTCGTGADSSGTFNISTAAALVAAAAGASVRKHLSAFFYAPALHPAMKAVMPVRRALGIRTIFHLVGPLSNPAGASAQVMGVYAPHLVPLAAEAMVLLNTRHAFVVHGDTGSAGGQAEGARSHAGMDEFSISGPS